MEGHPEWSRALELQFAWLESRVEILKVMRLSENKARSLTVIAEEENIIPSCDILPVFEECKQPHHEEFAGKTMWSLYNSFTEVASKYTPACATSSSRLNLRLTAGTRKNRGKTGKKFNF